MKADEHNNDYVVPVYESMQSWRRLWASVIAAGHIPN
jgi:hypothetical protein